MKFLLSLIYTSVSICSTATPMVIQSANNANKIRVNQIQNSQINIATLQESFISFYNTMLLEAKTQLTKVKFLFSEADSTVKLVSNQLESFTTLDISEKDDSKIVSYFNKMTNNYEQILVLILSLFSDVSNYYSQPIALEDNLESYSVDNTIRLYTRALNSSYMKLTSFFGDNIDKITKILGEDKLSKYYNSIVKDQEIINPEEYPLILSDIEYLTTNIIRNLVKKSHTSNAGFIKWYNELNQIIADASKCKDNSKEYYYIPKSDNLHLNKLKSKIDNEMELDIKKINDHLQRGQSMELLNSTGNNVNKLQPVVTNNVDFLYEIEVKISVRKEVLGNSENKLDRIKIEAIGSYAQKKLNEQNELQNKINELQSKLDNLMIDGSWSKELWTSGKPKSEKWDIKWDSKYFGNMKDFELTELTIMSFYGGYYSTGFTRNEVQYKNSDLHLDNLDYGQKMELSNAIMQNKSLDLSFEADMYDKKAWGEVNLYLSGSKSKIISQHVEHKLSDVKPKWFEKTWVRYARFSIKWKHKVDKDLNGWLDQIESNKSKKTWWIEK